MATDFQMPKLGLTMTEGTILEWIVASGTRVTGGTVILRVETDKVETDIEVLGDGVLHHLAAVGDTVECGGVVAILLGDGESPPPTAPERAAPSPPAPLTVSIPANGAPAPRTTHPAPARGEGGRILASPYARTVAAARGVDLRDVRGTGPGGRIVAADVDAVKTAVASSRIMASPNMGGTVPATAAARQLADLLGVDLAVVAVDPTDGRVTREAVALHVRALLRSAAPPASSTTMPATTSTGVPETPLTQVPSRTVRMSGMRGTIAKRMHASLREMAQLTLTMDADVSHILADQEARGGPGVAPGFTAYIVAAAARALVAHPIVNSQIVGGEIAVLPEIHVGLAVALDEGLVVPVVRHANRLDLSGTGAEAARLAGGARAGSLQLDDFAGGTFSVTALGMFGVDAFTPVINPPNSAILGVGRIRDELALVDGSVVVHKRLTLSLTWDHRVFDGAPAAAFCRNIATLLEDPAALDAV